MSNELMRSNNDMDMSAFSAFKAEGLEIVGLDLNASDMKLPKVKLMQETSQEKTKSRGKIQGGQFYNTVSQTAKDTIDCILLDQGKSMVMWKRPFKRGEEPLCRSFDGRVKAEGCGDGDCLTCKYSSQNPAAWRNLQDGETKPACNMSYVFLAMDVETRTPFRIIASGASVANAKDFLNKLATLRVSPFCCKVTLTSEQEENDQGIFYVMKFENLRPNEEILTNGMLDKDKYKELEDLSKSYKELFMTQIVAKDIIDIDVASNDTNDSEDGGLF